MQKPKVFVGSSKEGLDYARAIKAKLQDVASVTVWDENRWKPGRATLENLIDSLPSFDFSVLVLTSDDLTESRGLIAGAPRDNLVFELGLFMGYLGRHRTFFLCEKGPGNLKIPSDLMGITHIEFERKPGHEKDAIGRACRSIRSEIRTHGVWKVFQSPHVADRVRMTDWGDIYQRASRLVKEAKSKVRGTAFGTHGGLHDEKLKYFEGIAARAAERRKLRQDFMYKVVCSKQELNNDRNVALRNRKEIFEKYGVFDCLHAREIDSSWGVDFLIVDDRHLHVSFQRLGNNLLGLGLELLDAEEIVRPIVDWYDDCLYDQATPIDWSNL